MNVWCVCLGIAPGSRRGEKIRSGVCIAEVATRSTTMSLSIYKKQRRGTTDRVRRVASSLAMGGEGRKREMWQPAELT